MDNHQLCNQDSGCVEYYTPPKIIAAAHMLLGTIDLDPASSLKANETVKAKRIYTEADNGLALPWDGNVWMNHPFSRQGNREWIGKLVEEYGNGRVYAAVCICFAAVNAQWFQPLLHLPQFFPAQRINYLYPDGTVARGVTKDSVITYFPPIVRYAQWTGYSYPLAVNTLQGVFDRLGIAGKAK